MFCILKIENHPDRIIEEIYGPFESREHAQQLAIKMESDPYNYNGDHRLFRFDVRCMESESVALTFNCKPD